MSSLPKRQSIEDVSPARKKLLDWLAGKDLSTEDVAKLFECSRTYVSMMKSGAATPGLALAVRIEAVTGIPCGEWAIAKRSKASGG